MVLRCLLLIHSDEWRASGDWWSIFSCGVALWLIQVLASVTSGEWRASTECWNTFSCQNAMSTGFDMFWSWRVQRYHCNLIVQIPSLVCTSHRKRALSLPLFCSTSPNGIQPPWQKKKKTKGEFILRIRGHFTGLKDSVGAWQVTSESRRLFLHPRLYSLYTGLLCCSGFPVSGPVVAVTASWVLSFHLQPTDCYAASIPNSRDRENPIGLGPT